MHLEHSRKYTLWATNMGSWAINILFHSCFPFVLEICTGGVTHSFLFLNSNGMDVEYTRGDLSNFKAIGYIMDFYFFAGSSPLVVIDQFPSFVGRPVAMPNWSLGFHQSWYGYKMSPSLTLSWQNTTKYSSPRVHLVRYQPHGCVQNLHTGSHSLPARQNAHVCGQFACKGSEICLHH